MAKKIFLISLFSVSGLFAIFLYEKVKFDDGRFHIVFCNVGQGDGIFMRSPSGVDILVDAGPNDSILRCLSSHMPFWDRDLELVFLTHPHADHLTGFIEILKRYTVISFNTEMVSNNTLIYQKLQQVLKEKKINTRHISTGDVFTTSDGVKITTLWPSKKYIEKQSGEDTNIDKNSFSLVQLVEYKGMYVLLTGDIQAEILNRVAQQEVADIDILKVPHHGSYTGINRTTFDVITPALAVISVGKKNRYHHPASSVISLLSEKGIPFKRTDIDGEVEIVVSENGYTVK